MIDQAFFEFGDIRALAGSSWIPLREHSPVEYKRKGDATRLTGYTGIGTAAINRADRDAGDTVTWNDLNLGPHRSVYDTDEVYYPADRFRSWKAGVIGINLVIDQFIEETGEHSWHLHPDLVVALHLVREDDNWFRPEEGWAEVVRLYRDPNGAPSRIEMRLEHLRDYLAARDMDLLASSYRDRVAITPERPDYDWPEDYRTFEKGHDRHELSIRPGRHPDSRDQFRTTGALWRTEWVEGGNISPRVRGDAETDITSFVIDAEGKRLPANKIGGGIDWLYFRPAIVASLLRHKSATLGWFSAETGSLGATSFGVHFGINELGLVNVLAKDISRLEPWEQRLWSADNIVPDGSVSEELFAAQMEVDPAATIAPESELADAIAGVDQAFSAKYGEALLRPNERLGGISSRVHRFVASQDEGILLLSKELTRLFAERVEINAIDRIVKLPKDKNGNKPGSLKAIQALLETLIPPVNAHALMGPLFGIYDLRLADAHLGQDRIESGLERAQVDPKLPKVMQGRNLLGAFVGTLKDITSTIA